MDIHQTGQFFWYPWGRLQPSNHPCGIFGLSLDSLMASSHRKRSVMCLLNRDLVPKMQKVDIQNTPKATFLARTFSHTICPNFEVKKPTKQHSQGAVCLEQSARVRRRGCFKTFP